MPSINKIVAEHYRGASGRLELVLENKPVVIIFGENGNGKSTIADALDAVANLGKGSIGDKSSTRLKDHGPTIGKKPADVRIEVWCGRQSWTTTQSGDLLKTSPEPRPNIKVLRRGDIQQLVESTPASRYDALRPFIDVRGVEQAEDSLKKAADAAKTALQSAVNQRVDLEGQLENTWESEGRLGQSAASWAKDIAESDAADLAKDATLFRTAQETLQRAKASKAAADDAREALRERNAQLAQIDDEIAALPGITGQDSVELSALLRDAQHYLSMATPSEACPVCEKPVSLGELTNNIETRLAALSEYDEIRSRRERASTAALTASHLCDQRNLDLVRAAASALESLVQPRVAAIVGKDWSVDDYPDLAKDSAFSTEAAVEAVGRFLSSTSDAEQALADAESGATKKSAQTGPVRELNTRLADSVDSTERTANLAEALQQAYEIARLTRINFTQAILDEVAGECNRLYAAIHPEEQIGRLRLELDQKKRGSLNQSADFAGHEAVSPQAYYSQSHLDTLGFCLWIAIAKRDNPGSSAVIVLDDVFTSVDSQHITRVAELITDEAKHFGQVIITTHQRQWRDHYRYQHGPGRDAHLLELQKWSLAKGILTYETKLAVNELIDSLKALPFQRQETASKAGVLLESILDHLALQYRCRVPRTPDGSLTLQELLDGTESLFKKLESRRPEFSDGKPVDPPNHLLVDLRPTFNEIRGLAFIRNQVGAHFNLAGLEIPDSDVQRFASLTVQLAEALSCPKCGQIPGKKTGTHFQCGCPAPLDQRLIPLQV